jgi:predicted Zn-dependent protease
MMTKKYKKIILFIIFLIAIFGIFNLTRTRSKLQIEQNKLKKINHQLATIEINAKKYKSRANEIGKKLDKLNYETSDSPKYNKKEWRQNLYQSLFNESNKKSTDPILFVYLQPGSEKMQPELTKAISFWNRHAKRIIVKQAKGNSKDIAKAITIKFGKPVENILGQTDDFFISIDSGYKKSSYINENYKMSLTSKQTKNDLTKILTHEIGHALGLSHTYNSENNGHGQYSIMSVREEKSSWKGNLDSEFGPYEKIGIQWMLNYWNYLQNTKDNSVFFKADVASKADKLIEKREKIKTEIKKLSN